MTLILAVTNSKEIVVGADSLVYEGSGEVYRTYSTPKLRTINAGRWIIGFSGLANTASMVWDYLEAIKQTFNPDIRIGAFECVKRMGEFYRDNRLNLRDCRALLAGFSESRPKIYSWSVEHPNPDGGDMRPWGAIGCGGDLALHFARNCQPLEDLSTEQLSALAHFSIAEIAKSDNRVEKPIDLGIVTPETAHIEDRDSVNQRFERKSEILSGLISGQIRKL